MRTNQSSFEVWPSLLLDTMEHFRTLLQLVLHRNTFCPLGPQPNMSALAGRTMTLVRVDLLRSTPFERGKPRLILCYPQRNHNIVDSPDHCTEDLANASF